MPGEVVGTQSEDSDQPEGEELRPEAGGG